MNLGRSIFFAAGIAVMAWQLLKALRNRRIAWGRGPNLKLMYADMDRHPALFWLTVGMYITIIGFCAAFLFFGPQAVDNALRTWMG